MFSLPLTPPRFSPISHMSNSTHFLSLSPLNTNRHLKIIMKQNKINENKPEYDKKQANK